jgi:hypothetical protein
MSELSYEATKEIDEILGAIYRRDFLCHDDAAEMIVQELEEQGLEFDHDEVFDMVEAWWHANEEDEEDEDGSAASPKLMTYDFFHKTESNRGAHRTKHFRFELPTEDPKEALEMAKTLGLPKGSNRCGCFEIQSDLGVWSHKEDKPLRWDRPDDIVFTPW